MARKGGKLTVTPGADAASRHGLFVIDDETLPGAKDRLFNPFVDGETKGHGLVPRDYSVYPAEMFAPPAEMPLIPRSEWSARVKEQEREKSRVSDVLLAHGIPSLDQGPNGYCHTADTEVLTEKGFVAWPDYNWSDLLATVSPATGTMEYQAPFERHVYDYDGPMVYSTNRRVDFGVTPDHEMYVRKWDERLRTLSPNYSFVRAGDVGWYAGLMPAPRRWLGTELVELEVPGDRRYDGDDFLALLGLVVSDGYAGGTDNTKNWVSFASFREETLPAVRALAARVGFREAPSRPGVFIRYDAGALASWARANCYVGGRTGAHGKRVPDLVKAASARQIGHFLRWFDDRNRGGTQFYTASKRLADDLQELLLRVGKRASIGRRPAKDVPFAGNAKGVIKCGPSYVVTAAEADRLCIERKKHIETERYRGPVFCAAVPNRTLITRRGGTVLISSNCWGHSTVGCVQAVRALNNQPYVPLSAYMVCAIIKRGANEGAWCGLSAKFLREVGVCSQALWPQGNRNYRALDTPEVRADAAKRKVTEDWADLASAVYDQNLTFEQVASCLLSGVPCALDWNWWSHSVMGCDLVEVEPGSFGVRIRNSWGDAWEDRGFAVIRGQKAIPDGAVAVRVAGGA
jgi:hypothetical protein